MGSTITRYSSTPASAESSDAIAAGPQLDARGTAVMHSAGIHRSAILRVLVLSALCVAAACHRAPDAQQVVDAIDRAAAAVRANDVAGVLAITSDDFIGNQGAMDRDGLRRFLVLRMLRHDRTGVVLGPVTTEHNGDRIVAKFSLILSGGKPGDLLPADTTLYDMTTAWRHDGGHWRCYNATWSR